MSHYSTSYSYSVYRPTNLSKQLYLVDLKVSLIQVVEGLDLVFFKTKDLIISRLVTAGSTYPQQTIK